MFLKEGQVIYHGDSQALMSFYSIRGEHCPDNYNPSDFVMNLVQSKSMDELQSKALIVLKPDHVIKESTSESIREFDEDQLQFIAKSSLSTQLYELIKRECVNVYRDTGAMAGRVGVTWARSA